jgi:3-hydroxybutyryl-CoA dehydratase
MTLSAGTDLPVFTIESVSPDAMKDWAVFLADPNPIHLDVEVVKAKGLGDRVINQGPANVAYMINMLLAAFPGGRLTAMESRFTDNVYAGDRLTAGGTITAIDANEAQCDTWLRADGRDIVISGTAVISL